MDIQSELKKTKNNDLSPRQKKLIVHMLGASSMEQAIREARVSKATAYKWLKQQPFKKELERQREELIRQALQKLKSSISEAIDILISLMRNAKSEGVRLNSAREVLAFFLRAKEMEELSSRLMRIEKIVWERRTFG